MDPLVAAVLAAGTDLFAAAEAQQQTKSGDQEETQNGKPPAESPLGGCELHIVAIGTAIDTGSGCSLLHGNVYGLHNRLWRL